VVVAAAGPRVCGGGGMVLSVGALPSASDRAGREDKELDGLVAATFVGRTGSPNRPMCRRWSSPRSCPIPAPTSRPSLPPKIGRHDVYMVMDAPKNPVVEFRAKGRVELWDPWTGAASRSACSRDGAGTRSSCRWRITRPRSWCSRRARSTSIRRRARSGRRDDRLEGQWEFELRPTMDNATADFPPARCDKIIGQRRASCVTPSRAAMRRPGRSQIATTAAGSASLADSARSSGCWDRCRPSRRRDRTGTGQAHAGGPSTTGPGRRQVIQLASLCLLLALGLEDDQGTRAGMA